MENILNYVKAAQDKRKAEQELRAKEVEAYQASIKFLREQALEKLKPLEKLKYQDAYYEVNRSNEYDYKTVIINGGKKYKPQFEDYYLYPISIRLEINSQDQFIVYGGLRDRVFKTLDTALMHIAELVRVDE